MNTPHTHDPYQALRCVPSPTASILSVRQKSFWRPLRWTSLQSFSVGPEGLGWLRAAPSIGAICVALSIVHLPPFKKAGRTILVVLAVALLWPEMRRLGSLDAIEKTPLLNEEELQPQSADAV